MPVVRFQVVSGNQPHPVFVLDVKLAVEVYAWYVTMQTHKLDKVYAAVTASIISNDNTSVMVANGMDFHTSHPDVRVEVEKCWQEMLAGRSPYPWPERDVKVPVRANGK
jgi:hypothetical protein